MEWNRHSQHWAKALQDIQKHRIRYPFWRALDYESEVLQGFDLVIASIHSQLNMTEEKRWIDCWGHWKSIHPPCLDILRVDCFYPEKPILSITKMMIDHCAAHGFVLKSMPIRWGWIWISNGWNMPPTKCKDLHQPNAHNLRSITDIHWGVKWLKNWLVKSGLHQHTSFMNLIPGSPEGRTPTSFNFPLILKRNDSSKSGICFKEKLKAVI